VKESRHCNQRRAVACVGEDDWAHLNIEAYFRPLAHLQRARPGRLQQQPWGVDSRASTREPSPENWEHEELEESKHILLDTLPVRTSAAARRSYDRSDPRRYGRLRVRSVSPRGRRA
jgi:hypothetical protein